MGSLSKFKLKASYFNPPLSNRIKQDLKQKPNLYSSITQITDPDEKNSFYIQWNDVLKKLTLDTLKFWESIMGKHDLGEINIIGDIFAEHERGSCN